MSTRIARLGVPDIFGQVAQTPDFPNEPGAGQSGGPFTAMRKFSDGNEPGIDICAPDGCGGRFIIETEVIARQFGTTQLGRVLSDETATMFKMLPVKVLVNTCGGVNRRIIDAGYAIVVRGPRARIAVLAPVEAFDLDRGIPATGLEEAFEVEVFASACPPSCCRPPLPQLTYFRAMSPGDPPRVHTFVVPRGARTLELGTAPAGITEIQFWNGDPNTAAAFQVGAQPMIPSALFAAPQLIDNFGSATHILFNPGATAPGFIYMRWQIGG